MSHRLLAITQAADDPATRYRLDIHRDCLTQHGVEITSVVWPREERPRREVIARAADFDSVVVFRRLMRVRHVRALRKATPYLAYDFDDCVTRRDSSLGRPWPLLDKVLQFRAMVRAADAVTAGNEYLAERARRSGGGGQVLVVPTTIPLARYPWPNPFAETDPATVGWIGQPSTAVYLNRLRTPLETLTSDFPELIFRCIGSGPRWSETNLAVDVRPWSAAREVADLQSLTVGVAPLVDDAWTRGKCGLRLLQYLAAGVPAVAEPVGVQASIAREAGVPIARSPQEWRVQLRRLLADGDRREALREQGRAIVSRRYTPERWTTSLLSAWCRVHQTDMRTDNSAVASVA